MMPHSPSFWALQGYLKDLRTGLAMAIDDADHADIMLHEINQDELPLSRFEAIMESIECIQRSIRFADNLAKYLLEEMK